MGVRPVFIKMRISVPMLNTLWNSDIRRLGFGLRDGVVWDELSSKRRSKIKSTVKLAKKYLAA